MILALCIGSTAQMCNNSQWYADAEIAGWGNLVNAHDLPCQTYKTCYEVCFVIYPSHTVYVTVNNNCPSSHHK